MNFTDYNIPVSFYQMMTIYLSVKMMLIWIGIAVAAIILVILFTKILRSNSTDAYITNFVCKKCGRKTQGLKCIWCEKRKNYRDFI